MPYSFWYIQRHEKPHQSAPRLRCQEIAPRHIQRRLRGKQTDTLAIAEKPEFLLPRAALVRQRDIDQAYRLFRSAAAGPRDSRHSKAELRSGPLADALSQRQRDFWAHGALRFDDPRRNAHNLRLQFVAVAHHSP